MAALAELLREDALARKKATHDTDPHSPWHSSDGWRLNSTPQRSLLFRSNEVEKHLTIGYSPEAYHIGLDGRTTLASGQLLQEGEVRIDLEGNRLVVTVVASGERRHVFLHGRVHVFACVDPLYHTGEGGGAEGGLVAPMPGKVIALLATAGAKLEKGAPLMILEAMKMEHTITAPTAGTLKRYLYSAGDQVDDGAELVEFEAAKM